ncbi:DNA-binding IclR family transcriptional regulator [Rhodococcus sp. SMB37]|uniref:IclR family transcriptional regulator n=1 Tax=Rhodococcus sp. SMB37 TaxID=2512213 RepID=UPI0010F2EA08|nr:helix-turn-helix domain-containing protein [Rhodococcus sp. SMB37]TCN50759.1 DNA-binding IclR family transcriptional regulator [Rhodococcus sp. SMB37]
MTTALDGPHSVMGRVTALLEPFRDAEGLTLSELARRTGFPRSSAHRMLLQLVKVDLVRRNGTTYHLGPKLVELGALAVAHDRVHRAALPAMYDLRRDTGLVAHLAVLEGDSLLYLEKIGGRWSTSLHTRTGERRPAAETVEGAAALAFCEGNDGIAVGGDNIRCVAAAFNAGHGEIAVLSLTGPREHVPDDVGRRVHAAAHAVAAQIAASSLP